jgi:L-lactate dehydrogenase (cytochrome)
MSICSIEDVAEAVQKPFWFQLYVMRDRGFVCDLMERAAAAGCKVLMPTLDLPVPAQRHCDTKNGMTVPPRITLSNIFDVASKPRVAVSIAKGRRKTFGNLAGRVRGMEGVNTLAKWASAQFDPRLTWKHIEWIRDRWPGKKIVKGILDPEDARTAVKMRMQAMVVSNHGGRQLDGALSTAASLPAVAGAVKGDAEIIFDGGIRSGQDVLRALALGANACMIGRAYVHGLGAGGESGVAKAIEIIRNELDVTMALTGTASIEAVGRHLIADHSEPI